MWHVARKETGGFYNNYTINLNQKMTLSISTKQTLLLRNQNSPLILRAKLSQCGAQSRELLLRRRQNLHQQTRCEKTLLKNICGVSGQPIFWQLPGLPCIVFIH
jgi:hypothetical protein